MNDIYRISFLLCVILLITMIISCGPDEDSTKDDFLNDVSVKVTTMKQTIKDKIDQRDTDSFNEGDNIHLTVTIINNGNADIRIHDFGEMLSDKNFLMIYDSYGNECGRMGSIKMSTTKWITLGKKQGIRFFCSMLGADSDHDLYTRNPDLPPLGRGSYYFQFVVNLDDVHKVPCRTNFYIQ